MHSATRLILKIDITEREFQIVSEILKKYLPSNLNVFAFGTRANFTTRRASDLDLAIDIARSLTLEEQTMLGASFENSTLDYKVDLVDLNNISEEFFKVIKSQMVQII